MLRINKLLLVLLLVFGSRTISQNLEIITVAVTIDTLQLSVRELKIIPDNENAKKVREIIQYNSTAFKTPLVAQPEFRLQAKLDTLMYYSEKKMLNTAYYGFEEYEIYFDKNLIINFSINTTYFGTPKENVDFYMFDLKNGQSLGVNLFINPKRLLRKCKSKLRQTHNTAPKSLNDFTGIICVRKTNGPINSIAIMFPDSDLSYSVSSPRFVQADFRWDEIKCLIKPEYVSRLE